MGAKKHIICTVTNDLNYDQRMFRICSAMAEFGYQVTLVGRLRKLSKPLPERPYEQVRLRCLFEFGKLFYLEYNLRLFFYLLRQKADAIHIVDLDTMVPDVLAARSKGWNMVYDAHEYFSEMEEVVSRPKVQKVWQKVEKWGVPQVQAAFTVSEGYKALFEKDYPINFKVLRNVTMLDAGYTPQPNGKYILYQGAVNYGRALEQTILAMHEVEMPLIVCGGGDLLDHLKKLVDQEGLNDKVTFTGYLDPMALLEYTRNAFVGLTLFENQGLSNQYSLANRFFDYFHNGIPQLAMDYPEYRSFTKKHRVAHLITNCEPSTIAAGLNQIIQTEEYANQLRAATLVAREKVNWQLEKQVISDTYGQLWT